MKIGINLVGVSYNDGTIGRYRNFEDALDGFMVNVINPLKEEGHEIYFYIFTYDSIKRDEIIKSYSPIIKSEFTHPNYNGYGGGDKLPNTAIEIDEYLNSKNPNKEVVAAAINWIGKYDAKLFWEETYRNLIKFQADFPDIKIILIPWSSEILKYELYNSEKILI